MMNFTREEFFKEIISISRLCQNFWAKELNSQWPELGTYLKSLLADDESLQDFSKLWDTDISKARITASLVYLDHHETLPTQFSTFTEFSLALSLWLGPKRHLENKKALSAFFHLDSFIYKGLHGSEQEWASLCQRVFFEIDFLKTHLHHSHPELKLSSASSKAGLRAA